MGIAQEDYLKQLVLLQNQSTPVKLQDLSQRLGVTAAAVTDMVKKLDQLGDVVYSPYKGVTLTPVGEKKGLNLVRRHRIWEQFLSDYLGLPWSEVHEEAERLEHASSDRLIECLDAKLGYPVMDPHGSPIPASDGTVPEIGQGHALSSFSPGDVIDVVKVHDVDRDFLSYLSDLGLKLNQTLEVLATHDFDQSMDVLIDGKKHTLSAFTLQHVFAVSTLRKEQVTG